MTAASAEPSNYRFGVIVLGGGAAGIKAAIEAADAGASVVLLERTERLGKKILVSGGGKCNITNQQVIFENYHGNHPRFVQDVLKAWDEVDCVRWFNDLGVETEVDEENGKVWPTAMLSKVVMEALEYDLRRAGVEVVCQADVRRVQKQEDGFVVHASGIRGLLPEEGQDRTFHGSALVLATGGRAAPHLGANGSGLEIARSFGHEIVPQYPALVGLEIQQDWVTALSGLTCEDVELALEVGGRQVLTIRGSMLFTHYGINSPAVFRLSREVDEAIEAGKPVRVYVNFRPDIIQSAEDAAKVVFHMLSEHQKKRSGTAVGWIAGYRRLGDTLVRQIGGDPEKRVRELQKKDREALEQLLFRCPLDVAGTMGFGRAEAMRGGVDVRKVDPRTMASKLCEGLYICGEVLDIDGDVGGFNFQWAFSSGRAAGLAAAAYAKGHCAEVAG